METPQRHSNITLKQFKTRRILFLNDLRVVDCLTFCFFWAPLSYYLTVCQNNQQ